MYTPERVPYSNFDHVDGLKIEPRLQEHVRGSTAYSREWAFQMEALKIAVATHMDNEGAGEVRRAC